MKRLAALSSVSIVAALALAAPVVWAQQGSQATPRGGESPRGATAAPRGGGEGAPAHGGAGPMGGGSPAGGGSFGGSSFGGAGGGSGAGGYASSPRYRGNDAGSRRMSSDGIGQAVPRESRPRGDRPSTGGAVPRGSAPPNRGGGYNDGRNYYGNYWNNYYGNYYMNPYYYGFGSYYSRWGWPYYWGFGASYYYDPFYWGYGSWDPYYGSGGYGPRGGYYGGANYRMVGELKLKVQPREAEVYVDGYFAGSVDDFDGVFQSLRLEAEFGAGMAHRIEIRCQGYEPVSFEVRITPGHSITYRGELQRLPAAVK